MSSPFPGSAPATPPSYDRLGDQSRRDTLPWRFGRWLGFLACFLVIPGLLLEVALGRYLEMGAHHRRQALVMRATALLDGLEQCREDEVFFHQAFGRLMQKAEASADPAKFVSRLRDNLGRFYGHRIGLTAWDPRGRLLCLADGQTGSRKEWHKVWKLLRFTATGGRFHVEPEFIQRLGTCLELLGPMVHPLNFRNCLAHPWSPPPLLILARLHPQMEFLWFRTGGRVTLLFHVREAALDQQLGLRRAILAARAKGERLFSLGIAGHERHGWANVAAAPEWRDSGANLRSPSAGHPEQGLQPYTVGRPLDLEQFRLAEARFRVTCESEIETPDYLFVFRSLGKSGTAFAYLPRQRLSDLESARRNWLGLGLAALTPLVVGSFWLMVLGGRTFVSLRFKLGALFLFGGGLPLVVLGFLGKEYLNERERGLRDELRLEAEGLLRAMDAQFPNSLEPAGGYLKTRINRLVPDLVGRKPGEAELKRLQEVFTPLGPRMVYFIRRPQAGQNSEIYSLDDRTGRLELPEVRANRDKESQLMEAMAGKIIAILNREPSSSRAGVDRWDLMAEMVARGALEDRLNMALQALGRMVCMGTDNMNRWVFLLPLRLAVTDQFKDFAIGLWLGSQLQANYLFSTLGHLNRGYEGIRFLAKMQGSRSFFPRHPRLPPAVLDLARRVEIQRVSLVQRLRVGGRDFLAIGVPGQQLSEFVLLAFVPYERVDSVLRRVRGALFGFGAASLLLALLIGLGLSRGVLQPLGSLAEAANAIEDRRFAFRLPELGGDELGDLGHVLNRSMEGLKDLEVGKVVQQSLFPPGEFRHAGYSGAARLRRRKDLGGGFHDLSTDHRDRLVLVQGNIAGRGAAAALIMAIVKAGFFRHAKEASDPVSLLTHLHALLKRLSRPQAPTEMEAIALFLEQGGAVRAAGVGNGLRLIRVGAGGTMPILTGGYGRLGSPQIDLEEKTWQMGPGERILMVSESLWETPGRGEEPFSGLLPGLLADLGDRPVALQADEILHVWGQFRRGAPLSQDAGLVLVAREG